MRTERDKMLAGEQYNCHDPELLAMAVAARRRVARFCATDPGDEDGRFLLMQEIFASVGARAHIEPPFYADYGVQTTIGEDTFINVNCVMIDDAPVRIGARCLLGPGVQLITAVHPLRVADRRTPQERVDEGYARWQTMAAPVTVGDDVWLGASVIVVPGVTVGDRCTVGAGSVVTHDIPSDSLAIGTPAKIVRDLS